MAPGYHQTENERNGERLQRSLPNQFGKDVEWHVRLPGGINGLHNVAARHLKSFRSLVDGRLLVVRKLAHIIIPPGLTQWKRPANVPTGHDAGWRPRWHRLADVEVRALPEQVSPGIVCRTGARSLRSPRMPQRSGGSLERP